MKYKLLIGFFVVAIYISVVLNVSSCYYDMATHATLDAMDTGFKITEGGPDNPALDSLAHKRMVSLVMHDYYKRKAIQWERCLFLNDK